MLEPFKTEKGPFCSKLAASLESRQNVVRVPYMALSRKRLLGTSVACDLWTSCCNGAQLRGLRCLVRREEREVEERPDTWTIVAGSRLLLGPRVRLT